MKTQKCKKTITVSCNTWAELLKLKAELKARSINDVIKIMLKKFQNKKEVIKL